MMIDESQNIEAEAILIAPEQEATAAPEVVDTPQPEADEVSEPKTFTQEELDEIVRRRLEKAERKWKREQQPVETPQVEIHDQNEMTAEQLADRIVAAREAAKQQQELLHSYQEREEVAFEKYDDFQQVAYNPNLSVTEVMAQTIQASDIGPDVIYWLGSNPKEADRIARLPPIIQAKEIGKIEATLTANPPTKKTTSAPPPINPVTAISKGTPAYDTTDPRSIKTMSTSEWIEAERQRQIRKWEGQRR